MTMTPTSVAYTHAREGAVYALSVWGCRLICVMGTPRPESWIRPRYNPHTFFMSYR